MTLKILLAVLFGGLTGFFWPQLSSYIDPLVTIFLLCMMFFVGLDFGQDRELFSQLKKEGRTLIVYPILIAIGSLLGAFLIGFFLPIGVLESVACGSAFGWYSLSGPLLSKLVSEELGTIAFLANLLRELSTFLLIPLLGQLSKSRNGIKPLAFAPGGATTMDSTLPVVARVAGPKTALAAFISGTVLSMLVPFMLQFFASFLV